MMDVEEGFISVDGGRIWYRCVGRDGIPLLVLHGGPGAGHDYLEPLEALAADRMVVFYDQLGCGKSDRPDDPSLWRMERFVAEVDRQLSHGPPRRDGPVSPSGPGVPRARRGGAPIFMRTLKTTVGDLLTC
jgi:pimeloyl-ACP methyl ester carboxylesterase